MDEDAEQFRLMEKRIKNYAKEVLLKKSNVSKRQRLKLTTDRKEHENNFKWSEVLDFTQSVTEQDALDVPFARKNSLNEVYYNHVLHNMSHVVEGLYVVQNALSAEQQLYWAKKSVREYSKAEHNNLTNLQAIKASTLPKDAKADVGSTPEETLDVHNIWEMSKCEPVPFQTFARLRWSCLGYHYGIVHYFNLQPCMCL
jgi:hypothetical protein